MNLNWQSMLRYPFHDKNWPRKMLIGTVLSIIPIINVFTLGYFLACMRRGMRCRYNLPDWRDWDLYLQEGLWALLVILVYLLIPFICIFIIGGLPFIGGFFSSLIMLCMALLIPMALANYAASHQVQDAFRFGDIIKHIIQAQPSYTIVYILVIFLFSFLLILTILIPFFILISGFLFFYMGVVFSYLFGYIYCRG